MPKNILSTIDKHLLKALTEAYTARAKLFHNGVVASQVDLLLTDIDSIQPGDLNWNVKELRITPSALRRVTDSGAKPHQVFVHPKVLQQRPHLVAYYRNLAAISQKGVGQVLFSTARYESRRAKAMPAAEARALCQLLNQILSGVIDSIPNYEISISRATILAEIGAQLQGTWANYVGQGATRAVEGIIRDHLEKHHLLKNQNRRKYTLTNGWTVAFAAEPDVSFRDPKGVKRIAIEVKGSLDKAGAQTRYGEALKSFRKQLSENPRCHTVYLASCFTDSVIAQIKSDGQVRDWFNLTSILSDPQERTRFLKKIFHIVKTPR